MRVTIINAELNLVGLSLAPLSLWLNVTIDTNGSLLVQPKDLQQVLTKLISILATSPGPVHPVKPVGLIAGVWSAAKQHTMSKCQE